MDVARSPQPIGRDYEEDVAPKRDASWQVSHKPDGTERLEAAIQSA